MTKSLAELLVDLALEKEKYFQNYLSYAKKIKKEVRKFFKSAKVLIFGSILKKNEAARDIDLLVVTPEKIDLKTKRKILTKICQRIGFFHPFEFHFVTKKEFQNWYRCFIKRFKVI